MNPAGSVSGSIIGATGTGPAASSHRSHHVTGASFGTGGQGLPCSRCTFLNFSAGASCFFGNDM